MFKVALFGAGRIGHVHAGHAAAHAHLTFRYVVDPDRAAVDIAGSAGAETLDLRHAWADKGMAGLIVANATNAQWDQALAAAAAGKALSFEKPIDLNLQRATRRAAIKQSHVAAGLRPPPRSALSDAKISAGRRCHWPFGNLEQCRHHAAARLVSTNFPWSGQEHGHA